MKKERTTERCPYCNRRFKPTGLAAHMAAREAAGGLCPPTVRGKKWMHRPSITYPQDFMSAMRRQGSRRRWTKKQDVEHMT